MKTVQIEKRIYEHGDVVELRGNDRPNEVIRNDEEKIGITRFMIIDTNIRKNGAITARALQDNFNKILLTDEQLDKAEYVGKVDTGVLTNL